MFQIAQGIDFGFSTRSRKTIKVMRSWLWIKAAAAISGQDRSLRNLSRWGIITWKVIPWFWIKANITWAEDESEFWQIGFGGILETGSVFNQAIQYIVWYNVELREIICLMHSLGTSCRGISSQETNDLLSMIWFNFESGITLYDAEGFDKMQCNFV